MTSLLFDEDVVRRVQGSRLRLGLVLENYDNTTDDEESNSDSDSDRESSDDDGPKNKKGHVLVAWYPKGRTEVISQQEVELHDRSLLAGDLVQKSSSNSSCGQLGTVRMVHVTCHLQTLSTKQIIYNVPSTKIEQIAPIYLGTAVMLDNWIGEVEDTVTEIVVVLKNGARCALTEGAASKLTDVHDFAVEDSIFGEGDGFYPGQTLRGRASTFKSARWLSGQQPIMSSKAQFRVLVEEIVLVKLQVRWQTRGISGSKRLEEEDSLPPPVTISGNQLKRVKPLKFFSADKVQVGDKGIYQIQEGDVVSHAAVPKGSHMCYTRPENAHKVKKSSTPIGTPPLDRKRDTKDETKNATLDEDHTEEKTSLDQKGGNSELTVGSDEDDKAASKQEAAGKGSLSRKKKSHRSRDGQMQRDLLREVNDKEELVEKAYKVKSDLSRDVEMLCDLHKELCEASDSIVELTRSFQPLVANSSGKSAEDVKQRIRGLEESHAKLQEQICLTQDLLRDSEKSLGDLELVNLQAETILDDAKKARLKALHKSGISLHPGKSENSCEGPSDDNRYESTSDGSSHSSTEHQEKSKRTATSRRRKKQGRGVNRKRGSSHLKVSNRECIEVTHTHTVVDVEWQDGSMGMYIEAATLTPVDLLEDMHFFPGDFVTKGNDTQENVYGVVRSLEYNQRTCVVRWIRKPTQQSNVPEVIETEEVSVYDLLAHPDFQINIGETVVRIAYSTVPVSEGESDDEAKEQPVAGQVRWVTEDGKVLVAWVDGSESAVHPQDLYLLEGGSSISSSSDEDEGDWIDEEYPFHRSDSDSSSSSSSSSSGSWETVSEHSDSERRKDGNQAEGKAEVKGESKIVTKKEEGAEIDVTMGTDSKDAVTVDAIYDKDLKSSSNPEAVVSNKQSLMQLVASGSYGFVCKKSSGVTNGDVTHDSGVTNGDVTHHSGVTNSHTAKDVLECDRPIDDGSPNQNVVKESDAESTIEMNTVTAVTNSNEAQNGDVTERGRSEASAAATNERIENDRGTEELKDEMMKTEIEDESAIKGSPDKKNTELANVMELLNDVISDSERKDQVETATVATATANVKDDSHETEVECCVPPGTESETKSAISCQEDVANSETNEPKNDADIKKNMQDLSTCQHADGGKGFFTMVESASSSHRYFSTSVQPSDQRKFSSALKKEMQLLKTSLPSGIKVKMFEDKMHLFSALIEGPPSTPYEDCLFYFDGYLPDSYPRKPPVVHFHAYCAGKLNPNLYNEGKICVSLLDTWTGKGSEVWTGKSNLLQLFLSIQGLILNSEPYFNEAGYDKHRGTTHGTESSRMYNETVLIKVMQSVTNLIMNPPAVFKEETMDFFRVHSPRLTSRVEAWLSQEEGQEDTSSSSSGSGIGFPLFPLSRGFILSAHQVTSNLSSRWRKEFPAASKS